MKTVVAILGLLITTISFAQPKNLEVNATLDTVKVSNLKVSITVDSAEEVESTFNKKDFDKILNEVADNSDISFEIICNGDVMSNGQKSTLSYRIDGNTKDVKSFLKRMNKIKKAAIKYYKNKQN